MTTAPSDAPLAISLADVQAAAARLAGFAHRTPVMTSRTADAQTGGQLFFKCENLQRVGAFKFRGAFNAIASLPESERARGVVAFSSGNHAQAMALAGQLLDCPTTIVMPLDAPALKLAATRGYGATVVTYDRYREDREAIARDLAESQGLTVIPPFNHPAVMAGQGTAALELIEEVGALDCLLICVGGGGLAAGCATATAAKLPDCEIIGIEPAAGNDVQLSMQRGERVAIAVPETIADGAQTQQVGDLTFPILQATMNRIETVTDDALIRTMHWFAERMKLIVEPTGCLAAAAALEGVVPVRGRRVGIIVSGGNVDMQRYAALLATLAA